MYGEWKGREEGTPEAEKAWAEERKPPVPWESPKPDLTKSWVDKLDHLPEDTRAKYERPDGTWDPERLKLHAEIKDQVIGHLETVPDDQEPVAVVMMGGPAAGKTHMTKDFPKDRMAVLNADDIKDRLPEYREAVENRARNAGSATHEESSYLVKQLRDEAIGRRMNLLFDGSGANYDAYSKMVTRLQERGYRVKVIMAYVDPEIAVERNKTRAEEKGRLVPEDFLREAHRRAGQNFERIAALADDASLWDTGQEGRATQLWSRSLEDGETEHQPGALSSFRERVSR